MVQSVENRLVDQLFQQFLVFDDDSVSGCGALLDDGSICQLLLCPMKRRCALGPFGLAVIPSLI